MCFFVLLQLHRDPLETVSPASPPKIARWAAAPPGGERTPPASGRLAPGPDGRREASGVPTRAQGLKAAGGRPRKWRERPPLSASAASVGHRLLSADGASQSPAHFPPRSLPAGCGGGASPSPPFLGSSGGFRTADPPPAVTASPQVRRRLPLPARGPQRLPAEPGAAASEAA